MTRPDFIFLLFVEQQESTGQVRGVESNQAYIIGDIRVIDESGEDYLYPADYFILVKLPHAVEQALLQAV